MKSDTPDVALVFEKYKYLISLVDRATEKVLRQRQDYLGHHIAGLISDDLKTVVYITTDRHLWFPPMIQWWDLETDEVRTLASGHNIYTAWLEVACHWESGLVVLGGIDGFSAYDLTASRMLWSRMSESADSRRVVHDVSISSRGDLVCILQKRRVSIRRALTGDVLKHQLLAEDFMECMFQAGDSTIVLRPQEGNTVFSIAVDANS